jgi:ABC-2 type transport system permease protein
MSTFSSIGAIVRKEWQHYFGSPIAYVALFSWNLLFALFFLIGLNEFIDVSMNPRGGMMGGAPKPNLNEWIFRPTLMVMAQVALFILPMITMRLFAEEQRQGTWELLATSAITDWQIVLGKFFGAVSLFTMMVASSLINFGIVFLYADPRPEWKPILTGALGLLLVGSCFIALGAFVSTITKNQIVAGILSFCLFLAIWALSWLDNPMASAPVQTLAYLGIINHADDLMKGVIDTKDLIFYASFIGFGLFLTQQSIESRRWRE